MLWISLIIFSVFGIIIAISIILYRKLVCKPNDRTKGICTYLQFPNAKHPKMRKIWAIILITLLFGLIAGSISNISNRLGFIRVNTTGYAEWRESNDHPYLYVTADNPYDMGYHAGKELGWKILYMKLYLVGTGSFYGFSYSELCEVSLNFEQYIPEDHLEELRGLADGATQSTGFFISYKDALIQHVFTEATYGHLEPRGCSVIGVNNTDGSVTIGQNWDFSNAFKPIITWVHAETPGKASTFTLRGGACLSLICGKNEHDLSLLSSLFSLNQVANFMMPLSSITKLALETAANLDEMSDIIYANSLSSYGYSIMFGNSTDFYASQHLPSQYQFNTSDLVVFTNTYTIDEWQTYLLDPDYSRERQLYIEGKLTTAYLDGIVTESELLDILSDEPMVGRTGSSLFDSSTCAFFTTDKFGFGIAGTNLGICPI